MIRLECPGVGRDKDNIAALEFYFNRRVTDEEMRFLHDVMRRAVACSPIPGALDRVGLLISDGVADPDFSER